MRIHKVEKGKLHVLRGVTTAWGYGPYECGMDSDHRDKKVYFKTRKLLQAQVDAGAFCKRCLKAIGGLGRIKIR